MPWGLKRYQQARDLHFVTFSCYRRRPFLQPAAAKRVFERALEQTRRQYAFWVTAYVIMPEHVHLLVSEPERTPLAHALQALKQSVARRLIAGREHFWQARYYDFNVFTSKKRVEKLRYMHRNPVKRGLVQEPQDWPWSSFRHYLTGEEGVVEIETQGTGRKRERMGMPLRVKLVDNPITFDNPKELPHPSKPGLDGALSRC
jgi:putative transposase